MKTVKELCKEYGYSQTALAKRFGIPLRTVQDWCRELRTPPSWLVPMVEEILKRERAGEPKTAKWIQGPGVFICSKCKGRALYRKSGTVLAWSYYVAKTDHCPHCGAEMKEE